MKLTEKDIAIMKGVTGCVMALMLAAFFCIASWFGKTVDATTYLEVCGLAAAFAGVAWASLRTIRTSDYEYKKIVGENDAKVAAAKAGPSPVAVTSDVTTVNAPVTLEPLPLVRSD